MNAFLNAIYEDQEILDLVIGEPLNSVASYLPALLTAVNACLVLSVTDCDGVILFATDRFCELSGFDKDDLTGRRHNIVSSGTSSESFYRDMWDTVLSGKRWTGEICNRAKDGSLYWVDTTILPFTDTHGKITRFVAICNDVTNKKQAEQQLNQSRQRLKSLLLMSGDWYWEQDTQFRFTLLSDGFKKTGKDPAAFLGQTSWDAQCAQDEALWHKHRATLQSQQPFRDFEFLVTSDQNTGLPVWFSLSGEPTYDERGQFMGYQGVGRDISTRFSDQAQLWKLSNLDSLTGLPNRSRFETTLDRCVESGKASGEPFALVMIDIDNLKVVNDSMSFLAGDELLKIMARRLSCSVRQTDFISRLSGDEFAVILLDLGTVKDIHRLIETLRCTLEAPTDNAEQGRCTLSLGASLFPAHASASADLIKNANIALHRAKSNGGGQCVLFESEHKHRVDRRATVLRAIEQAISVDRLMLYYQPVVNPVTRAVVSFEALLRWNHPKNGIISPGEFQEVFENRALTARIGKFVTDMAIKQAALWSRERVDFHKIAINVTTADFVLGGFPIWLADRLMHYGVDPAQICVEVTEGMFLGPSAELVLSGLQIVHDMGAEIAFDDFGTGYASLMHLKMPIDRLKIERTFVTNIENDKTNAAIIEAIVQLGRRLGKGITVEGVETQAQADILLAIGCSQFQGYLYSKPLPAHQVASFIASYSGSKTTASQLSA
ncbi:diguanylate cyclase/phosphodiesterase (GGDEF & EAL domains) with PAS/PAC sensor(s) (plasmid) [Rhodoferax ferrireducens T118]|uniref:Diguanylate cyclase/phosphodiesterase (GGDEF & EAL domains) with PAS/PAC sensor(S) n=1 Tax=Albidiferax ferrireducens (strain ATCC BAA-621 / DSM 15236 / T118) TaxID=338969 RepID=Q21Q72_ALBFT|nr:bifunctional diguanylate cyclase/phosphodiesterase [Rhodoferax ferrireducens]ABD72073.1 diguanylate cyclase/phosphodiesterase (GGDEF & EAL domains) with PAS/PAC sensor(s) [Rhodoferax ferrireducens T118]